MFERDNMAYTLNIAITCIIIKLAWIGGWVNSRYDRGMFMNFGTVSLTQHQSHRAASLPFSAGSGTGSRVR